MSGWEGRLVDCKWVNGWIGGWVGKQIGGVPTKERVDDDRAN